MIKWYDITCSLKLYTIQKCTIFAMILIQRNEWYHIRTSEGGDNDSIW